MSEDRERYHVLKGGKEDLDCNDGCDMCEVCEIKRDVAQLYADMVLNNEITMLDALKESFETGFEFGYDKMILDDISAKEELLLYRQGVFEE